MTSLGPRPLHSRNNLLSIIEMSDQVAISRPAERRVLRDEIRERLIEAILDGRLPPGTRIIEKRLGEQLGVSQGPVREALRDLELFGFVVSSPFRGTVVRKFSRKTSLKSIPSARHSKDSRRARPRRASTT